MREIPGISTRTIDDGYPDYLRWSRTRPRTARRDRLPEPAVSFVIEGGAVNLIVYPHPHSKAVTHYHVGHKPGSQRKR